MNKGKFPFSNLKINTEAKMNCWLTKINMMLYLSQAVFCATVVQVRKLAPQKSL